MALMMVLPILAITPIAQAQSTVISLEGGPVTGVDVGETFDLTLQITDAVDVFAWKVALDYDPSVVEFVSASEEPFLSSAGATFFQGIAANDVLCSMMSLVGVDGSGALATITFEVVGYTTGPVAINLIDTELLDSDAAHNLIAHTTVGTTIDNPAPSASAPTAKFTPAAGTWYTVGDLIELDASTSLPGFDSLPAPGTSNPVTDWAWEIDLENDGSVDMTFSGETSSFTAASGSTNPFEIAITLTVTAPDADASETHQDYVETNSVTKVINVQDVPSGAYLDVFTDRGGEGPAAVSDAYGPQELITIYAEVTYNDAPVIGKDVAFEIIDITGETIAYRSGRTNATGFATVSYRTPWMDENPEDLFGTWNITATVDVSEVVISDYVTFEFNYIIRIVDVDVVDAYGNSVSSVARGETVNVKITYENIRAVDVDSIIAITVYDEASVPVVASYVSVSCTAGATAEVTLNGVIPSWSFVGQGTAFGNAYDQLPQLMGVPFCPEVSANFQISQ